MAVAEARDLPASAAISRPGTPAAAGQGGLSGREAEVLRLLAAGLTNAQIAARLALSPHSVDGHVRRVYRKLGVHSRSAATRAAIEYGLA